MGFYRAVYTPPPPESHLLHLLALPKLCFQAANFLVALVQRLLKQIQPLQAHDGFTAVPISASISVSILVTMSSLSVAESPSSTHSSCSCLRADLFGLVDGSGAFVELLLLQAQDVVLCLAFLYQAAVLGIQLLCCREDIVPEGLLTLLLRFQEFLHSPVLCLL